MNLTIRLCALLLFLDLVIPMPERDIIKQMTKVSYRECQQTCRNTGLRCYSIKYSRRFLLCSLYEYYYSGELIGDEKVYYNECLGLWENCGWEEVGNCGSPDEIIGATVLGNMVNEGARIKIQCIGNDKHDISTCTSSGHWSPVDLQCRCTNVRDVNDIPVENVKTWHFSQVNETTVLARPECKDGFTPILSGISDPNAIISCDIATDTWSDVSKMCCNRYSVSDTAQHDFYSRIFSYPSANTVGDAAEAFRVNNVPPTAYCHYRNTDYIQNWPGADIVNITLIKEDEIRAWIAFNGTGTTVTEWMQKRYFISSSWSVVNDSPLETLHIDMNPAVRGKYPRFLVGVKNTTDKQYNPGYPKGWLTVTLRDLVTYSPYDKPLIIFSSSDQPATLQKDPIDTNELADRLEIWVRNYQTF